MYGVQYMGMALETSKRLKDERAKKKDRISKSLVSIPKCAQNDIKEYQQSNDPIRELYQTNVVKQHTGLILQVNMMRRFRWWIDTEYLGDHRFKRIVFEDMKTSLNKHSMTRMKTAEGRWGFHHFVLKSQEDVPLSHDADMPMSHDADVPMSHDADMPMSSETDIRCRCHAITKRRREAIVEPVGNDSGELAH